MAVLLYKWLLLTFIPFHMLLPGQTSAIRANPHPFFISVTEINHNSKEKSIEVSCKIFADDMEETLKKNFKTSVDLTDTKHQAQADKLIADYIKRNLLIQADGKLIPLNYLGFEKDKESVYCYFEGQNIAGLKKMIIQNSLLQDFTDKQINIMHVTVGGKRQSIKLDYPAKEARFNF